MREIDAEMEAAVNKYGPIDIPDTSHIQDFYNRIDANKNKIVKSA